MKSLQTQLLQCEALRKKVHRDLGDELEDQVPFVVWRVLGLWWVFRFMMFYGYIWLLCWGYFILYFIGVWMMVLRR